MDTKTQDMSNEMNALANDARALVAATSEVANDKVAEARKRLSAALERVGEFYGTVREKAAETAKVADQAVHQHPYQAIAIAVGFGVLVGYLLGRRSN